MLAALANVVGKVGPLFCARAGALVVEGRLVLCYVYLGFHISIGAFMFLSDFVRRNGGGRRGGTTASGALLLLLAWRGILLDHPCWEPWIAGCNPSSR
jgi:hypothetical protein